MKSLRDFILGKIRRTEWQADEMCRAAPGPDPSLGAAQICLALGEGSIAFYEDGLTWVARDDAAPGRCTYACIEHIALGQTAGGEGCLGVRTESGHETLLSGSPETLFITHAALRWMAHVRFRRDVDRGWAPFERYATTEAASDPNEGGRSALSVQEGV